MKLQLHRVGLDGKGRRAADRSGVPPHDRQLYPRARRRRPERPAVTAAAASLPTTSYFVDVYQTHDMPPATRLVDARTASGRRVGEERSDASLHAARPEEGRDVHLQGRGRHDDAARASCSFRRHFDPTKKYPVLVSVYGGPASASNTARETFITPSPLTEYGFLLVNLDSRAAPGQGKRVARHDLPETRAGRDRRSWRKASRRSRNRPYLRSRPASGSYGTSYGGYAAVMSLLRHPDVFSAASASSPVTAWYHYDTIYTERYMWLPDENKAGYEAGSAMTYAKNLKGPPDAVLRDGRQQRAPVKYDAARSTALQQAGKSFDLQVGPDRGPQRRERRPDDGVLHRESDDETASDGLELLNNAAAAPVSGARTSYVRAYALTIYRDQRNHHDRNQGHNGPDGDPADSSCHRQPPERCLLQAADRSTFSGGVSDPLARWVRLTRTGPAGRSEFERPGWTGNGDPVRVQIQRHTVP